MKKTIFIDFLACKGLLLLSNDDVGVTRGITVFQAARPGVRFKENFGGGYTVERLRPHSKS